MLRERLHIKAIILARVCVSRQIPPCTAPPEARDAHRRQCPAHISPCPVLCRMHRRGRDCKYRTDGGDLLFFGSSFIVDFNKQLKSTNICS